MITVVPFKLCGLECIWLPLDNTILCHRPKHKQRYRLRQLKRLARAIGGRVEAL